MAATRKRRKALAIPASFTLPDPAPDGFTDLGAVLEAMERQVPGLVEDITSRLAVEDVEAIERSLAQVSETGWRATPATMAEHLDPTYRRWPYVDLLARNFARAFRGDEPHQIWNLPSQYGKTTSLVWGILWALDFDPTLRIMFVSYDADRAVEEGGRARDLAERHAADLRFELRPDRRARGMWRTTEGGGLYCVGVNGAITGFPADAVLLDDLIKGWQAAHSDAQRSHVMNVYRSQVRMRVQGGHCPIILAGTRWHELDPSGQLAALAADEPGADQWAITRLPAIAEAPDPTATDPLLRAPDALGRDPGVVLEAERFTADEVRARQLALGSYLWAAMEQQRPAPEEGGELKRAWWQWADAAPPRLDDALTSWDTKLKDKKGGDYVVGQAWGRTGSDFWWLDQLRGQWNMVTTKTAIVLMHVRHPEIGRHVIENTGNGPEVIEQLRAPAPGYEVGDDVRSELGITDDEVDAVNRVFRRGMPGLIPENPKGDKVARARAFSGLAEAGNVHLLLGRPEAEAFVNEAAGFPNGAHDDMVDAWSQAMKKLTRAQATVQAPPSDRPLASPAPSARARVSGARTGRRIGRPASR